MATAAEWVAGARPRTLPAAVVPVLVGTSTAHVAGQVVWWRAVAALIVSLAIQVGTNYANDYSDGIRGTDEVRVGPVRLVAARLASPPAVRTAAITSFGVAGVVGLVLAVATTPWLLLVGAACIAAGWFYTGGPRPYGYAGLGEAFVFVFFGLVAVMGTSYVASGHVTLLAFEAAVPVGLLATSLLVVNNLRDIPTDAAAGKRTLAVHLGDGRTRVLYVAAVAVALAFTVVIATHRPYALIALAAAVPAVRPIRLVAGGAEGRALVAVLGMTGLVQLVYGVLLAVGIWL